MTRYLQDIIRLEEPNKGRFSEDIVINIPGREEIVFTVQGEVYYKILTTLLRFFDTTVPYHVLYSDTKVAAIATDLGVYVTTLNTRLQPYGLVIINDYMAGYAIKELKEGVTKLKSVRPRALTLSSGIEMEVVCSVKHLECIQYFANHEGEDLTLAQIRSDLKLKNDLEVKNIVSVINKILRGTSCVISTTTFKNKVISYKFEVSES